MPAVSTAAVAQDLGGGIHVKADGTIAATSPAAGESPTEALNKLALSPADATNAFAKVTDKALLTKIADKLVATHKGLSGQATDDATVLQWRQARAASLGLMEQAAIRAKALGDDTLAKSLTTKLVDAIKKEPFRGVRDFAFESLVGRAEAKDLPAVKAAREALYPSKPPYDKWLADGKIGIFMVLDNDGSLIKDNVTYYKSIGFKAKEQTDGSWILTKAGKAGKPTIEITIPALPKDGSAPALFDEMDNKKYDVIGYGGHAGYGQRIERALESGVKGTGEDKAIILMQCWGEGNVESLERTFPDAQMISTTAMTTDNYDWELMNRLFEGFEKKAGWEDMRKKTVADLKEYFPEDIQSGSLKPDEHYFFPTTRSVLVAKTDRDGDGVADQGDHIFNVIYPKRVDAAGGYDPVVQPVPKYALDGTSLNQAINQVSLVVRYDRLLPPNLESKVVWNADKWKAGGFFEPAAGDTKAFQFKKNAAGEVEVALSTKFAHTGKQELSRMMGYEAGLWLAKEAGLTGADKTALAVGMTQRVVAAQGSWASSSGQLLDEPWAEEALFAKRYGLSGFTFGELDKLLGESHDDFKPEHYKKIADKVKTLPGVAALAERAPTTVGTPLPVNGEIKFISESSWSSVTQAAMDSAMRKLGVDGTVKSFSPSFLNQNQATNVTAVVVKDGKSTVVSLGVDSEGIVRAATKLDLNLTQKVAMTMREVLSSGFTSTPAVAAEFDAKRAAGKSVLEATRAAMAKAPAGSSAPSFWELDNLERMGLLSTSESAELKSAMRRGNP